MRSHGLHTDGFGHPPLGPSVIPIANDYYAGAPGRVLVPGFDPTRVASDIRYEAAAPIAAGGSSHRASAPYFPNVYAPIDKYAIMGPGVMGRAAPRSALQVSSPE